MIVEFVGSSGAGKSSLVERVLGSAPQGPALVDAWGLRDRPTRPAMGQAADGPEPGR